MFLKNYFLLFLFFLGYSVYGQQYISTHYDTRNGLPGSNVHGISQDKDGFIWFSTETGLSRFDGTHFRNFTTADGLPTNEVFGTLVDSKNRVWLTVFKNSVCYYLDGKIHNQQNDSLLARFNMLNENITSYAEDKEANIIMQSRHNTYILYANNRIEVFNTGNAIEDALKKLPLHDIVRSTGYFSIELINTKLNASLMTIPENRYWGRSYADNNLFRKNIYLYGNFNEFVYFSSEDSALNIAPFGGKLNRIENRARIIDDSLIAVFNYYGGGVKVYNTNKKAYTHIYLPEYNIHDVYKDTENNLWFSTAGSGVFKVSPLAAVSYNLGTDKSPLPVLDIQKIDGDFYIGSEAETFWKMTPGISHKVPEEIKADIGLFTKKSRPFYITCSSSNFLHATVTLSDSGMGSIKTIFLKNDTALVASNENAVLYTQSAGTFKRIQYLYRHRTTCAYYKNGIYYIGTVSGLYAVFPGNKLIFVGDHIPLFRNRISSFAETPDGTLWVATYEKGIVGYRNGKVISNITVANGGLTSNIVRCLHAKNNVLWAGTEKGLNKIDLTAVNPGVTEKFTEEDGLDADIVNAIYADGNMIYVGTSRGLCVFDETNVPVYTPCNIRLTDITVSGKEMIPANNNLVLEHNDNNIRFQFVGISFLSSGHMTYKYRMLGLSDKWQTTEETTLSYPSLPSGNYTLELIAINKFGKQSDLLKQNFTIQKTIWEQNWFRIILGITLLLLIGLIMQAYVRRIRLKGKQEREIERNIASLRQRALRAQMNPHFIFNSMNSIQHYILHNDPVTANEYLSEFASLMRKTLDINSADTISLSNEIAYLNNYLLLEKMRFEDKFVYQVTYAEDLDIKKIEIPSMIIQPFAENAIKHGIRYLNDNSGKLEIHFKKEKHFIICSIEDNGIGRKASAKEKALSAKKHTSKGMNLTEERLELISKISHLKFEVIIIDKYDAENKAAGTLVTIKYPTTI
ncbi:MAG: two-component regulator propeller domain-containing protein [Ferruginibacter sp.]